MRRFLLVFASGLAACTTSMPPPDASEEIELLCEKRDVCRGTNVLATCIDERAETFTGLTADCKELEHDLYVCLSALSCDALQDHSDLGVEGGPCENELEASLLAQCRESRFD